jgi:hypothetical protein
MNIELTYTRKDDLESVWYIPDTRSGPVLGRFTLDVFGIIRVVSCIATNPECIF